MSAFLNSISPYLVPFQVFFLILATFLILIQNRGAGLSSQFGGHNEVYLTRRGIEKWVIYLTVASISLFVILRIVSLYTV